MTKSVKELLLFIKDTFEDTSEAHILLSQIHAICAASIQLEASIIQLTRLEGGIVLTKIISSRTNADLNDEIKREAKLNLGISMKITVVLSFNKLKNILKSSNKSMRTIKAAFKQKTRVSVCTNAIANLPNPENG